MKILNASATAFLTSHFWTTVLIAHIVTFLIWIKVVWRLRWRFLIASLMVLFGLYAFISDVQGKCYIPKSYWKDLNGWFSTYAYRS